LFSVIWIEPGTFCRRGRRPSQRLRHTHVAPSPC
jgi:hypothetical protein